MTVLVAKLAIAAMCCLLTVMLARARGLQSFPEGHFYRLALIVLIATRLAIFVTAFGIMHYEVQSDVPAAYYPEAHAAISGKLVYRDFFTTYGPLFPYVCALPVLLWDSTKSIVLFAILMEAVGFLVWMSLGRSMGDSLRLRTAIIFYIFNPLLLTTVPVAGQNHIWISPFVAIAALSAMNNKAWLAGAWTALSTAVTKFLAVVFALPLFLCTARKKEFVLSFAAISLVVYGGLLACGADVLIPLRFQRSTGQESSGNLPYLLSSVGIPMTSLIYPIAALLCLGVLTLLGFRLGTKSSGFVLDFSYVVVGVYGLVLLFSKKSFTSYWAAGFFCLCLVVAYYFFSNWRVWSAFLGWSFAAAVEPSLYYRWAKTAALDQFGAWFHQQPTEASVFLLVQFIQVAFQVWIVVQFFAWLWHRCWRNNSSDGVSSSESGVRMVTG